jgi:hypothetical protein
MLLITDQGGCMIDVNQEIWLMPEITGIVAAEFFG